MGLIQKLLRKSGEDKQEFKKRLKEAEMEYKVQKKLEDKLKSSNERELEAHMKKLREDDIKTKLDRIHKQQNKEMWKGKHQILDKGKSILTDDRPLLKEKNIFKSKSNLNNKGMFFK